MLNYEITSKAVLFPVPLGVLSVFELEQLEHSDSKSHPSYTPLLPLRAYGKQSEPQGNEEGTLHGAPRYK